MDLLNNRGENTEELSTQMDTLKTDLEKNIRVTIDSRSEKIGAKIRDAELNKIPIMLIAGEKEMNTNTVSMRRRFQGDLGSFKVNELLLKLNNEVNNKDKGLKTD